MKKRTVVIASLLKPIDDTRSFEKFGKSLSDSGNYHVVIIGYLSTIKPAYPNIDFVSLKAFKRLSLSRLIAPLQVLQKIFQVKHDILIVNTHELLIVGLLNRIIFGRKIVYDIQENYYRNILYTNAFPELLKPILAVFVRAKEKLTAPFYHHFFLAEKGYQSELTFTRNRDIVIENKPRIVPEFVRTNTSSKTRLLFSGTLSESTGVFQAIDLAKKLHDLDTKITFHIIGFAALQSTLLKIKNEIIGHDFISLTGGDHLVPHREIMKAIHNADFGIIIYPASPHTQNSMPTKLYEYVALKLPILLRDHRPWVDFCRPIEAALILEESRNPEELLAQMKSKVFYTKESDSSWATEETKLLHALKNI